MFNNYFIINKREFARKIEKKIIINNFSVKSDNYFEIQIKNETRPSIIIEEEDRIDFNLNKNGNGYLSFGVAPLINDYVSSNFTSWEVILILIDKDNKKSKRSFSLPYNGYGGIKFR